jgi:hypothetical protein
MNHLARMTIGAAVTVLAACATTPDTIPELDEARARVQTLEQNPLAQQEPRSDGVARCARPGRAGFAGPPGPRKDRASRLPR